MSRKNKKKKKQERRQINQGEEQEIESLEEKEERRKKEHIERLGILSQNALDKIRKARVCYANGELIPSKVLCGQYNIFYNLYRIKEPFKDFPEELDEKYSEIFAHQREIGLPAEEIFSLFERAVNNEVVKLAIEKYKEYRVNY